MERKESTTINGAWGLVARAVERLGKIAGSGGVRLRVKGDSMLPGLPHGSAVTVGHCLGRLVPGTLIVYRRGGDLIVHRVVAIRHGSNGKVILTRGDNNRYCDDPVSEREVLGRVVAIEPSSPD